MRIGVEIGGTFTDLVAQAPGGLRTIKVASTPDRPEQAVFSALDALESPLDDVACIVHGSTVATNALLERRGAATLFVTTEGFRDLLELQREVKSRNYDLRYRRTAPLVPRERVLEARERLDATGQVIEALDEAALRKDLARMLAAHPVGAVAVCLLHAWANPVHERRVRDIALSLRPDLAVSLSSEVMPEFREYERASTTVMNAYLAPVVEGYLARLADGLAQRGFRGRFYVMQSNGGMLPAERTAQHAVRTVLSGPAAGVIGAVAAAAAAGLRDLVTLDMGGTSTDVSLVRDGTPDLATGRAIDRLPVLVPVLDIETIGAGGGSLARLDEHGLLTVGPTSAGAVPGPACYGRGGTEPTLTDALVVLNLLRPDAFLGGRMRLAATAARAAVAALAARLGMDAEQTAEGIVAIAVAHLLQATRQVSVERGHDPRDFAIVAYGGAGPVFAATLAEELGAGTVFVPPDPGVMSATGLLAADFRRDYVRTIARPLAALDDAALRDALRALAAQAAHDIAAMRPEGMPRFEQAADLRYAGQGYELTVPIAAADTKDLAGLLAGRFHHLHRARFGHAYPKEAVRLVNLRLRLTVPQPAHAAGSGRRGTASQAEGTLHWQGQRLACRYLSRAGLTSGTAVEGPAVIEEDTASTLIPPGWRGRLHAGGGLLITRQEERA